MVGLLLARIDLRQAGITRRMIVWGAVAAVGAAVLAQASYAILGERADTGPLRLLTGVAHGQMPLWLISSVGGAVFIIGVCLRWEKRASRVRGLLADTGRFAFTAYVLHVIVLALIKPADGFTLGTGILVSAVLSAVVVGAAALWSRSGRPGPLEWLLRNSWLTGRSTASAPNAGSDRRRPRSAPQGFFMTCLPSRLATGALLLSLTVVTACAPPSNTIADDDAQRTTTSVPTQVTPPLPSAPATTQYPGQTTDPDPDTTGPDDTDGTTATGPEPEKRLGSYGVSAGHPRAAEAGTLMLAQGATPSTPPSRPPSPTRCSSR